MHLNLVLSHFLSSSHLILPLQCWINFKGHWSQKSLTLALLMDSHHPNAALKSDVYSKLCLLAQWRARGVGVVYLFTALLRLAVGIFARITASTRCCLPPCNSLLQWNLLGSAGLRAKRENTDVCLWELDGCLTRYIGLYHPRNWSIVSIQKSRNHTRPSRSLQPGSPDLVFHGFCLWYFRQSQRSKNTLFFSKDDFFIVSITKKGCQSTEETLHPDNIHPQVLPWSLFLLWPAKIRCVGVRYHPHKRIRCPEKFIM